MRFKAVLVIVLLPAAVSAQSSIGCTDLSGGQLQHCFMTQTGEGQIQGFGRLSTIDDGTWLTAIDAPDVAIGAGLLSSKPVRKEHFHWRRALTESAAFFAIEQSYVIQDDFRWFVIENGVPFNHYWRDYKQSLSTWIHSGWDDGDPALYSYLGHPLQGAMTGYIQVQNDPQGEKLEFSNSKPYWHSRLKAMLWSAVYSTQWNIGPLSELTFEKYGSKTRPPWNHDGTWPCHEKECLTGVGQVDLVTTPLGGFAWMVMEDVLDRKVVRHVESSTGNLFWIDVTRCALNPIRSGANILHGKRPWYRASRDGHGNYLADQR